MDKEGFLETLRKQYTDEIREAFLECEHEGGKVDAQTLEKKLWKLMKAAKTEGLPTRQFEDLVRAALPEYWQKIAMLAINAA